MAPGGAFVPGHGDHRVTSRARQLPLSQSLALATAGALVAFALLYVLVLAEPDAPEFGGNWRTTNFGSALDDWESFSARSSTG